MAWAKVVVFLGDGAVWIWKLARLNFPGAGGILDFYHATENLMLLANALYGEGSPQAKQRFGRWRRYGLADKIAPVIAQAQADLPRGGKARTSAQKQIAHLRRNRSRRLYQNVRAALLSRGFDDFWKASLPIA